MRSLGVQGFRFVIAGGTVAVVYIGLVLAMSGPFGVPIQIAIPIAFWLGVALNYTLQRFFVFRNSPAFALAWHAQLGRYVGLSICQYLFTAITTHALPPRLGVSEQAVYVAATVIASGTTFVLLRIGVFHDHSPAGD